MRLKQYLESKLASGNYGYVMYYKAEHQDGTEDSNHEYFKDKKDAAKTLEAYKTQLDPEVIKNIYYWDDAGNTVTLIWNGKIVRKRVTVKMLESTINELSMSKNTEINYTAKNRQEYSALIKLEDGQEYEIWTHPCGVLNSADEDDKRWSTMPIYNLMYKKPTIEKWEIFFADEDRNIETVPKSKGTSVQLFAAVEKFVTDWIKTIRPEAIEFSSGPSETSKFKLYILLAKKIARSGYNHYTIRKEQYLIRSDLIKKDLNKNL